MSKIAPFLRYYFTAEKKGGEIMKKIAFMLAIILVISAPLTVSAATYAMSIRPVLSFEGTAATCEVTVSGIKAGVVTITATMTDGPSATYTVYVTIEDGVYYISNMFSGYCLQTEGRKITDFTTVVQDYKLQSTVAETARIAQMWRIAYLDEGKYTIRPISKVDVCLYAEWCTSAWAEPVVIYPHADDDYENVPTRAQWTITMTDRGYAIQYCGVAEYSLQAAGGSGIAGADVVVSAYHSGYSCHWDISPVDEVPTGIVLYDLNTGLPADCTQVRYITKEEVRSLQSLGVELVVYPDMSNKEYIRYDVTDQSIAEMKDNGYVTGIGSGTTMISMRLYNTYEICIPLHVTALPSGTYYIRNRFSFQYASAETTVGSNVTQKMFNPGEITGWEVRHTGQGYYTIRSTIEGAEYYLGISDEISQENANIVLCADASTEKTQWEILMLESGAYTLRLKGSSYSLGLKYRLFGDYDSSGIALQQKAFQSDKKFEWLFCEVSNAMILEPQKRDIWCWAASARMMASIYMNSHISQEAAAVYVTSGNDKTDTFFPTDDQLTAAYRNGTNDLKMAVLNYLLGRKGDYGLVCATRPDRIYSREDLCRILDAGHPVMINRSIAEGDELKTGHATVIYDYYYDEEGILKFVIYDPLTINNCTYENGKFSTVAQIYHRTYEWILDSRQNPSDEDDSIILGEVWESAVVFIYYKDYTTIENEYRRDYK